MGHLRPAHFRSGTHARNCECESQCHSRLSLSARHGHGARVTVRAWCEPATPDGEVVCRFGLFHRENCFPKKATLRECACIAVRAWGAARRGEQGTRRGGAGVPVLPTVPYYGFHGPRACGGLRANTGLLCIE
jgi:hypothetical protein